MNRGFTPSEPSDSVDVLRKGDPESHAHNRATFSNRRPEHPTNFRAPWTEELFGFSRETEQLVPKRSEEKRIDSGVSAGRLASSKSNKKVSNDPRRASLSGEVSSREEN